MQIDANSPETKDSMTGKYLSFLIIYIHSLLCIENWSFNSIIFIYNDDAVVLEDNLHAFKLIFHISFVSINLNINYHPPNFYDINFSYKA